MSQIQVKAVGGTIKISAVKDGIRLRADEFYRVNLLIPHSEVDAFADAVDSCWVKTVEDLKANKKANR